MQQITLNDAITHAKNNAHDEDLRRIAVLASSHLDALKDSDNSYKDDEFYTIVKEVSRNQSSIESNREVGRVVSSFFFLFNPLYWYPPHYCTTHCTHYSMGIHSIFCC